MNIFPPGGNGLSRKTHSTIPPRGPDVVIDTVAPFDAEAETYPLDSRDLVCGASQKYGPVSR